MENSKDLLQLPDEVLKSILNFIPDRFEVAQVCKKFYKLVCDIDENKYKMNFGKRYNQPLDTASIINTQRVFNSVDAWLDFSNAEEVQLLSEIFQRHGSNVTELKWSNWSSFVFKADVFASMLNLMPNLTKLEVSSWNVNFTDKENQAKALKLGRLKSLTMTECDPFLLDYFAQALPSNILVEFKIKQMTAPKETLKKFFDNQTSIKDLSLEGDLSDATAFEHLKLTHLKCVLNENESPSDQRNVLEALINSQRELVSVDFLTDRDYAFAFVNDEIFQEICKLSHLESLNINIDGISPGTVQSIAKLLKLKNFETKTNRESSLEVFNELSLLKNLSLEHLILHLWSFEIPAQTYQQLGQNTKLKSLEITLGTWHKINFFVESFPHLESLKIRFGEANNTVEFSKVFTDDGQRYQNMKSLKFQFWGKEMIDEEMFIKMIKSFPNLEKLNVHSKFPLSSDFLGKLANNLSKIKALTISQISINNNTKFSLEIIERFKELRSKLSFCKLTLSNIQDAFKDGGEDGVDRNFTYETLVNALKIDFKMQTSGMSNIRIHNNLVMTAGHELKED